MKTTGSIMAKQVKWSQQWNWHIVQFPKCYQDQSPSSRHSCRSTSSRAWGALSRDDSSWLDSTWVCCSWRRAWYRLLILARLQLASLQCSRSLVQTSALCVSSSQVGDKYSGYNELWWGAIVERDESVSWSYSEGTQLNGIRSEESKGHSNTRNRT